MLFKRGRWTESEDAIVGDRWDTLMRDLAETRQRHPDVKLPRHTYARAAPVVDVNFRVRVPIVLRPSL
jgi:hypothetical protein